VFAALCVGTDSFGTGSVAAMADLLSLDDVRAAARAISGHVERTPTIPSPGMSSLLGVPVTLKLELLQRTGSFKPRGVAAKLLSLSRDGREAGVVAVSGGNHGIAVAEVAAGMQVRATVVMAKTAPTRSIERIRAAGADLRLTEDMGAAFALLDELVAGGMTLVHPFDDPTVLAGQGTVGLEFAEDTPPLTDVLVSIGGGGLISGVAVALKALLPDVRIWGVETEGADAMARALAAGAPVDIAPSSIASTLSAPHASQLTLDHVRAHVEEVFVVPDAEAVRGMVAFAEEAKLWVEPATGCLMPAASKVIERGDDDVSLGFVVCGGNVTQRDVRGWIDRLL
jgi:threonine dehydratase